MTAVYTDPKMKSAAASDRDASPPSLDSFIEGETRDGKTFQVPKTRNVVTSVALPHKWNVMSFFTVALVLISADAVWRDRWSTTTHVLLFFFWRACYNIGLGVLLDIQSRYAPSLPPPPVRLSPLPSPPYPCSPLPEKRLTASSTPQAPRHLQALHPRANGGAQVSAGPPVLAHCVP